MENQLFQFKKDKYISCVKSGKKYFYIDKDVEKIKDNVYTNSDVDKLVSILGNDVITYKQERMIGMNMKHLGNLKNIH